jgi:PAS domain S-box-containing protein
MAKLGDYLESWPLRRKLIGIIFLVSSVASAGGFAFYVLRDLGALRDAVAHDGVLIAHTVGHYSAADLAFRDHDAAQDTLAGLAGVPDVANAFLFDEHGRLFASLHSTPMVNGLPLGEAEVAEFRDDFFHVIEPVHFENKHYGSIYLLISLERLSQGARDAWLTFAVLLATILAVSMLLAFRLQRLVSRPILHLAQIAKKVAEGSPFPRASAPPARDEIGSLFGSFFAMLDRIQQRESERDRAYRALQDSESRVRLLLNSTAEAIYGLDLNGTCTFVNPACVRMLGYQREEDLVGKDMHALIHHTHGDGRPYPVEHCKLRLAALQGVPVHVDEEVHWRAGGSSFAVEYWSHPMYREGELVGAVVTFVDISARRQSEEALRLSEEKHRLLFETMAQGVVYQNSAGRIISANVAAQRMLGLSLEQMLGRTSVDPRWRTIREDGTDLPSEAHPSMEALRTGQPVHNTVMGVFRPRDERWVWILVSAIPQFAPGEKNPRQVYATFTDITAQRESEQALIRQREFLAALLDNIEDGIVACDGDGVLTLFNRATQRFHGLPQQALPAHLWADYYDLYLADGITPMTKNQVPLFRALNGERIRGEEMVIAPKQGTARAVLASGQAFYDPSGMKLGAVVSMHDITERKKAELELSRHREQLEELVQSRTAALAEVNKELEAFSYSVSHDLRAPLRAIDGFSKALIEDYGSRFDAQGSDYLQRVRAGAQRMAALIDDLLKLSRITRSTLRPEDVDMSALAIAVVQNLREAQPERTVDVHIQSAMHSHGDRGLLRVLLENLLGNAWKYSAKRERAVIEFDARPEAEGVVYRISDNGAGFDMRYADKLFGAFQRLHRADEFEGTGIGLATVQRIVRRHGGRIWAQSEPDKGAQFFFVIGQVEAATYDSSQ